MRQPHLAAGITLLTALLALLTPHAQAVSVQKMWWDCVDETQKRWNLVAQQAPDAACGLHTQHHARTFHVDEDAWAACIPEQRARRALQFVHTVLGDRAWCGQATCYQGRCPRVFAVNPDEWPRVLQDILDVWEIEG